MLTNGEGRQVTASTTSEVLTFDKSGANSVSIDVAGSNDIYVLVNISKADFDTAKAAGKAIKVRAGLQFAFYGDKITNISSIAYEAASDTSAVNIAAF